MTYPCSSAITEKDGVIGYRCGVEPKDDRSGASRQSTPRGLDKVVSSIKRKCAVRISETVRRQRGSVGNSIIAVATFIIRIAIKRIVCN